MCCSRHLCPEYKCVDAANSSLALEDNDSVDVPTNLFPYAEASRGASFEANIAHGSGEGYRYSGHGVSTGLYEASEDPSADDDYLGSGGDYIDYTGSGLHDAHRDASSNEDYNDDDGDGTMPLPPPTYISALAPPSPAPAITNLQDSPVGPSEATATYHCAVCGHVYDPRRDGDGRPFEKLPESWQCPVCGAPKAAFRRVDARRLGRLSGGEWREGEGAAVYAH